MANPGWAFGLRGAAENADTLEIDIYQDIGPDWWGDTVSAKSVRDAIKNSKATLIKLHVNSAGGDVFEGMAIYNMLAEHPAKVVAQVDALAASMASIVIMAADEITVSSTSMIMIHNPWGFAVGEADDMRQTADLLDKMRGQLADVYVARTGIAKDRVLSLMDAETWMTASEAKADGFADTIIPAKKGESQSKALASLRFDGLVSPPKSLLAACARARGESAAPSHTGVEPTQENKDMKDRAALCAAVGLSPDVSDDVIMQHVRAMHANAGKPPEGFELTPKGELATAQARANKAEADLAVQAKATRETAVNATLDEAVKAGKIVPASREKYAALCSTDVGFETVKELVASLPVSALVGVQGSSGKPPMSEDGCGRRTALNASEIAHCEKHNLDQALYLKSINEER